MQLRKYRWSRQYESAEEELVALLARKNISAQRWTGTDDMPETERHFSHDTQLWCAEGLLFCTVNGSRFSLQPGDTLDIPADSDCLMRVGFGGCTAYESHPA